MKNINFKQPKYILPLILLPFLCLFYYVYHSGFAQKKIEKKQQAGINGTVGEVSTDVQGQHLADKLDTYRDTYKEADGMTAVSALPKEESSNPSYNNNYSDKEKKMLDSINIAMRDKYANKSSPGDKALANALTGLSNRHSSNYASNPAPPPKDKDPMEMFKQQMSYVDSINKANDPSYKAEKIKKEALAKDAAIKAQEINLPVSKADTLISEFNTIMPKKANAFITAVIDEGITGYAGSRIRLRLLENILAGDIMVKKNTYVFALISGFSGQRVTLSVKSILYEGKILPVKLEIYDQDGLPGLYVPESAFRDFTKDASSSVIQGTDLQSTSTSFVVSAAGKLFESTSSAIAGMIRKDKAKIKYNSYLYLIDNDALQNAQKRY